jgi:hypothetical protein
MANRADGGHTWATANTAVQSLMRRDRDVEDRSADACCFSVRFNHSSFTPRPISAAQIPSCIPRQEHPRLWRPLLEHGPR